MRIKFPYLPINPAQDSGDGLVFWPEVTLPIAVGIYDEKKCKFIISLWLLYSTHLLVGY